MCDVGEYLCNTKKLTIILLPEYQYRPKSKLRVREIIWKFPQKKPAKKETKEMKIQIRKPLKL